MTRSTGEAVVRSQEGRAGKYIRDNGTAVAERAAVVRETLTWRFTAFHHRGRVKATRDEHGLVLDRGGVDCAQSVYLIYRAAVPHLVPEIADADRHYAFAWNLSKETAHEERYLKTVLDHAREVAHALPGDLALFQWGLAWAHGAIVVPPGWPAIAHANADAGMFMTDRADAGRLKLRRVRFFSLWGPRE
jgi:cell wall-associated NlpC family hydrolase